MDVQQTLHVQSAALGQNVHVYDPDHAVGSRCTDVWKFNKLKSRNQQIQIHDVNLEKDS